MPRRRPRRHLRPLAALGLVALLAGFGANGAAQAQTSGGTDLADQFGGYKLASHGNGLLLAFDAVGFVPNNPRVLQQGLPEAQATGASGTNYALSSLDYPGSVVGDLGAIVAQGGGGDAGAAIPSYPVQARAYYPSGPTEVRQEVAGAGMVSLTTATTSDGTATYSGNDLPQFLHSTGVTVHANTHLEDGRAVSQLRAEMTDVDFAGVLHIGSLVTDIRADTDGNQGASSGTTTVSGVTFLGLPATIDDTGVHLTDAGGGGGGGSSTTTTTAKPSVLDPVLGPVTSQVPLNGLSDALKPVAQGLTTLITSAVGASGTVNDLLEQGGIKIRLLAPIANDSGPTADRVANGLSIEMAYNPNTNATLGQLVSLVPSSQLPSDPLVPGSPVNSSPQGLVSLLQQVYGMTLTLVPGAVTSQASPPFTAPAFSAPSAVGSSGHSTGSLPGGSKGFTTPAPALGGGGGGGSNPSGTPGDALPVSFLGDAIPVWAAILLLLSAPLWGAASSKLADNTLAAAGSSCPEGLDAPDPPGGAT